jgi:hypothetical protein
LNVSQLIYILHSTFKQKKLLKKFYHLNVNLHSFKLHFMIKKMDFGDLQLDKNFYSLMK